MMRAVAVTLGLSLAGACLFACEDDTTSQPPTTSSSSSGGSSGGGSSSGGTGEPEPFTPPVKLKTGALNVFIGTPATENTLRVAGYFLDYSAAAAGTVPDGFSYGGIRASECTSRKSGTCEAVRCKMTKDASLAFAEAKYASAGEVSIRRANGTELKATPAAQSNNVYIAEVPDPAPGVEGETLTITAAGGDVPPFTETVELGPKVAAKSPAEMSVSKGTDAKIEWTPGRGTMRVYGATPSDADFTVTMMCTFEASAGSGTIPGLLLGDDVAGKKLSLGLYTIAKVTTAGDYAIDITATMSNDGLGGGNVQLEVK